MLSLYGERRWPLCCVKSTAVSTKKKRENAVAIEVKRGFVQVHLGSLQPEEKGVLF